MDFKKNGKQLYDNNGFETLLQEQAQFLLQILECNKSVLDNVKSGQIDDIDSDFAHIHELESKISKTDWLLKQQFEKQPKKDSFSKSNLVSLISNLANQNQDVLSDLQLCLKDYLKNYAQNLKQTRNSNKMIKSFQGMRNQNSTIEYNV